MLVSKLKYVITSYSIHYTKLYEAIATEEYGASFFSNGANPGGVLEHPGVVKDPKRVRESWNAVYQGRNNFV